ncbi:MAG: response regulator transcription factor [Coriobacteriales bacterium]|jgi:DNA-binding CsgD family transcriptional regulator
MNSNNRKVALALGLTFGAIWTGDSVFLEALGPAFSVLYMRCASAVLYLLFLLCAKLFYEKHERAAKSRSEHLVASGRFLIPSCIIGLCCYIAGGTLILFNFGHPYLGFALTKIIGAPLTIGSVYLFGSPGRINVMRDTAESVSLSFFIFALARFLMSSTLIDSTISALASFILLAAATALITRETDGVMNLLKDLDARNEKPEVILRPLHKIMNAPLIAGLMLVSLMLGFVRHGLGSVNPPDALIILVFMTLTMLGLYLYKKGLSLSLFFQVGVVCMTAAILLESLLALSKFPLENLLLWYSSAAFETTSMMLCIWTSHNSTRPFFAAIISRTIMVFGHLLGTLIILGEMLLSLEVPGGGTIAPSVLVFIFILMLLFSYRIPTLQVIFFSLPPNDFDAEVSPEGEALNAAAEGRKPDEVPNASAVMSKEEQWRDHRRRSCRRVADTYSLTKREIDVLYELSEGRSVSYMADRFVLSPNTVKMHIRHIYQKLDVHSKQEVIDIVNAAGELVDDDDQQKVVD